MKYEDLPEEVKKKIEELEEKEDVEVIKHMPVEGYTHTESRKVSPEDLDKLPPEVQEQMKADYMKFMEDGPPDDMKDGKVTRTYPISDEVYTAESIEDLPPEIQERIKELKKKGVKVGYSEQIGEDELFEDKVVTITRKVKAPCSRKSGCMIFTIIIFYILLYITLSSI